MPLPTRPFRSASALIAAALTSASGMAHAQEATRTPYFVQRVLVDRELRTRAVKLVSFDATTISIMDIGGLIRTEPLDKYLAIITPGPVTQAIALEDRAAAVDASEIPGFLPWSPGEPERADLLTLVDGQRLTGHPDSREAQPDQFITWDHPSFGPLRVSLEKVKRIDVSPTSVFALASGTAAKNDVLLLANGDRMEGFVASTSDPMKVEVNKKALTLPWARIQSVLFAAPTQRPTGTLIWLADGTTLRVSSMAGAPNRKVKLAPTLSPGVASENPGEAPLMTVPVAALASVLFDASTIVPLAGLPLADDGGKALLRSVKIDAGLDQPLGAGPIEFSRPGAAAFTLPAGAVRLAFGAELPPDCWSWGDCELVVSVSQNGKSTELSRQHLSAEHPRADLNLPLDTPAGSVLTLRVDEGAYGPIQDRVILRRGLLQLRPQ